MDGNATYFLLVMTAGLSAAGFALALRDAEERHPASDDIEVRTGLAHMMIGILSRVALIAIFAAGVYVLGAIKPVAISVFLTLSLHFTNFGDRLIPVYRLQLPLVIAALISGLWLWFSLITLIQGGL